MFVYRSLVLSRAHPMVTSTVQTNLPSNLLPPRPVLNLSMSLSCESVPTQMAAFLCGQSPFQHPARMPSIMDDDIERESSWERFSGRRWFQDESARRLSP